jgi:hypothetical protein
MEAAHAARPVLDAPHLGLGQARLVGLAAARAEGAAPGQGGQRRLRRGTEPSRPTV